MKRFFEKGVVRSKRQPSLPGFPDIPDVLEVRIPSMPAWEQIGGDMDPAAHGGLIARTDESSLGKQIEMLEIQPVRAYVGDGEAAEVGFPFWTKEAYYTLEDLDLKSKDVQSALESSGFTEGDQKYWFEEEATPEQRALAIAESLFSYGYQTADGPSGWSSDLPDYEVKWMSGQVAMLPEYIADEDDSFRDDVLGYSDIRQALEEKVDEMANASAAQTWSTVDDSTVDKLTREGFDPDSIVGLADFNGALAINGELANTTEEKTFENVSRNLELEGYEETDRGGKIPTTEEEVDPDSVIRAVARDGGHDRETVAEAARGIDWWPKDRHDMIYTSVSGWGSVWAQKDKHAHVDDGDYVIQPAYADGTIVGGLGGGGGESFSMNDEQAAIAAAKAVLRDPTFEGDYVTVITRDGELVWDSRGSETEEAPRRSRRRR